MNMSIPLGIRCMIFETIHYCVYNVYFGQGAYFKSMNLNLAFVLCTQQIQVYKVETPVSYDIVCSHKRMIRFYASMATNLIKRRI